MRLGLRPTVTTMLVKAAPAGDKSPFGNADFVRKKSGGPAGMIWGSTPDGKQKVRWTDGSKTEHHHSELDGVPTD